MYPPGYVPPYTPPGIYTTVPPRVHHVRTYWVTCTSVLRWVSREEALGSKKEVYPGYEAHRALLLLRV